MGLRCIREERARAAREEAARYSKEAMAAAAGVSLPKYDRLEERPGTMTMEQASRLAEWLGCGTEDLLAAPEAKIN